MRISIAARLAAYVSLFALGCAGQAALAQEGPATQSGASDPDEAGPPEARQSQVRDSEIVVTAQRREETAQDIALAINAVGGDTLQQAGISDVTALTKLVPALVTQPATGTSTSFYIRGVGSFVGNAFTENPIAFNFNQVYISRPAALLGTFYDLERVEVLKGPQGTLYGRNATGGAINVIPARPGIGERSLELGFEVGNYASIRATGSVNLPLGNSAALRLAGQAVDRDGYLSDGYDDENGQAARASLAFESGRFEGVIVADYFQQGGRGRGSVLVPSPLAPGAPDPDDRIGAADPMASQALFDAIQASALPPFAKADGALPGIFRPRTDGFADGEFWGVSGNFDWDLDFATVSFVPAYRSSKPNYLTYSGGYYGRVIEDAEQLSFELRLASNGGGPLQYILGAYYFDENLSSFNHFVQGTTLSTKFETDLDNKSMAAFGQATYEIFPDFRVLGGLRYSEEKKINNTGLTATGFFAGNPVDPFNNNVPPVFTGGTAKFDKITWKAGVEWDVTPDSLLYANIATGFKSGGFFVATLDNTFGPEILTAYTIGSKNQFFDRRLTLNLEAFYWDYKDQQVNYIGPVRNRNAAGDLVIGAGLVTTNAGASRIYGAEAELRFELTSDDRFAANIQYLNGKFEEFSYLASSASPVPPRTACNATPVQDPSFPVTPPATTFLIDCSGKPQINTPEWSALFSYEHSFWLSDTLELVAGARTKIESSRFLSPEYLPEMEQEGYMTSDLWLTLQEDRWSLTAFVDNVEDETVYGGTALRPIFPVVFNILRPPRTYGLRGSVRF